MTKTFEIDQFEAALLLRAVREAHCNTLMAIEAATAKKDHWKIENLNEQSTLELGTIKHLLTTWNTKARGVCPICHGFGWDRIPEHSRKWYPEKHFMQCRNCGGQYQGGVTETSRGMVNFHTISGLPCSHDYTLKNIGRCYNQYTCKNCGDTHTIDSGD